MISFTAKARPRIALVLLTLLILPYAVFAQQAKPTGPPLLAYADLVKLYEEDRPSGQLQSRLTQLLNTPFVSNLASARGATALKPDSPRLGKFIRVAFWNIERGLEFDGIKAAFTSNTRYFQQIESQGESSDQDCRAEAIEQAGILKQADIVILNEVDWGLKRTDYRNVVKELADAMNMNYAYGVEFVEVDPLTLGTESLEEETGEDKEDLVKNIAVDKSRTLGLHGNAILSRYPLRNVRIIRFDNQGHDWYAGEKKAISKLEAGKRKVSGAVLQEKVLREVRRGGRMMLIADIEDKEIPGGKVTVVATHIEAKTKPASRVKQLEELLSHLKEINNPVIVAGDMNTSGSDTTPTSLEREFKKRMGSSSFWAKKAIKYSTGFGLLYDITLGVVKAKRTQNDPTVKSVKFFSENPEEHFFTTLKDYRFADGGAFDFRGTEDISTGGHENTLANSNERASKGFVPTFEIQGKVKINLKLDWILIKPARLTDPEDAKQSYLFAPHFGRTLRELNFCAKDGISDHTPMVVDLPFKVQ